MNGSFLKVNILELSIENTLNALPSIQIQCDSQTASSSVR